VRPLVLLVSAATLLLLASCNKLQFRSDRPQGSVPARLEGEWRGQWQSSQSNAGGDIVLRVQEFEDQPVFGVFVNHPCMPTTTYEIEFTGFAIELSSGGEVLFRGALTPDRQMLGTFECDQDTGTWQVQWDRDLPPLVDLTGTWQGQITTVNGSTPLNMQFDQRVVQGVLEVTGLLALPSELVSPLPVRGFVRSRDGFFELAVTTVPGILPQVVIGGTGDSSSLAVQAGMVATSGQPLSFTQGVASFAQLPQ